MIKRYFLVNYNYQSLSRQGYGNLWFESESFPSNVKIKESVKVIGESVNVKDIVVTNIFEFKSREDYEAFIAGEEDI